MECEAGQEGQQTIYKGHHSYPRTQTQRASDLASEAVTPFLDHAKQMIFVISAQWDL